MKFNPLGSIALIVALVFVAVEPLGTRITLAQSSGTGDQSGVLLEGLEAARFIHEQLAGAPPATDGQCEYTLDRPVDGDGVYSASLGAAGASAVEVFASAPAPLSLNPGFVPPDGTHEIRVALCLMIVTGPGGAWPVVGRVHNTEYIDGSESGSVAVIAVLAHSAVETLRFDPIQWAMSQTGYSPAALAEEEYAELHRHPQPDQDPPGTAPSEGFAPCAADCDRKYNALEGLFQLQHDQNTQAALTTMLSSINAAAATYAAAKASARSALLGNYLTMIGTAIVGCLGAPFTGPFGPVVTWTTAVTCFSIAGSASAAYVQTLAAARSACVASVAAAIATYRAAVLAEDRYLALVMVALSRDRACCRTKCESVPCPEGIWPTPLSNE